MDVLSHRVVVALRQRRLTLSLAESCTGGSIASRLIRIPGASAVVESGVVTYSNAAKVRIAPAARRTIQRHGAVSAETAEAMAAGILAWSGADVALAVTGVAGPAGATPRKPVGLVYLGIARAVSPDVSHNRLHDEFHGKPHPSSTQPALFRWRLRLPHGDRVWLQRRAGDFALKRICDVIATTAMGRSRCDQDVVAIGNLHH